MHPRASERIWTGELRVPPSAAPHRPTLYCARSPLLPPPSNATQEAALRGQARDDQEGKRERPSHLCPAAVAPNKPPRRKRHQGRRRSQQQWTLWRCCRRLQRWRTSRHRHYGSRRSSTQCIRILTATPSQRTKRRQRDAGVFLEGIQYGEINPTAFVRALSWCSPKQGESFIDLGSGTGKAVMTAAATYAFSSATGVELLRPLHDAAVAALARSDANTLFTKDVRFVCADALEHDWIGHDIVFVSLTCFSDEQVARVAAGAEKMRVGARLLVTTKALEGRNSQGHADGKRAFPSLKLLHNDQLHYGKGKLTFRAYERV